MCHARWLFSIARKVRDENLLLLNWTKKEEIYYITADNDKYILRVKDDGSLVVVKAGESTQVGVPSIRECVCICVYA